MKLVKIKIAISGILAILAIAFLAACQTVSMEKYEGLFVKQVDERESGPHDLKITFLGNTNILISDGTNAILTDGFFTRPGLPSVILGVKPDPVTVRKVMDQYNIDQLDVVIPLHAHFDHAMDSPFVAEVTGATLIGDHNIAQINKGWRQSKLFRSYYGNLDIELPELKFHDKSKVASSDDCKTQDLLCDSKFKIIFFEGEHYDHPLDTHGLIDKPIKYPSRIGSYKRSEDHILLIAHEGRKIMVIGSAGRIPEDVMNDTRLEDIDVILIAVPGLSKLKSDISNYEKIVQRADVVIPIHWDSFFDYSKKENGYVTSKPPIWILDRSSQTRQSIDTLCQMTVTDNNKASFGFMEFGKPYSISSLAAHEMTASCPD